MLGRLRLLRLKEGQGRALFFYWMLEMQLSINGQILTLSLPADTTLLDVLRNELQLTGARYGCGQEQCGACMVLVDGAPAYACTRDLASVQGRMVVTVEGLGTPDRPHALQLAFVDEQAGQCGYCLSGMIVSAAALLTNNPQPTRGEIAAALDPHLCRCGAHPRILRAVAHAAKAGAVA